MNLEYKIMEQTDFKACAYELIEAFKEAPWNENWTFEQAYTRIDEIMSARVSRGYVIYDGDVVVAMICGRIMTYLDYKELWIDEFSVNPRYQRKGIGGKMLDFVRAELKKEKDKITYLELNTGKDFPCVKFYESQGFRVEESSVSMIAKI